MSKVKDDTLKWAYKPFDVVSINTPEGGAVGFISEVSVDDSQDTRDAQISYSVTWISGTGGYSAWWDHDELIYHCNLFVKIAQGMCNSFGDSELDVVRLLNNFNLPLSKY